MNPPKWFQEFEKRNNSRFDKIETRLDKIENRLDRVEDVLKRNNLK
jgi:archaellum component FlaC